MIGRFRAHADRVPCLPSVVSRTLSTAAWVAFLLSVPSSDYPVGSYLLIVLFCSLVRLFATFPVLFLLFVV